MKVVLTLALAASLVSFSLACNSSPKASEAQTTQIHECPACKDKVTWLYGHWPGGPKGIPTGKRVVTHECPECKKSWSSAVVDHSTCATCNQQAAMCPACQAHSK